MVVWEPRDYERGKHPGGIEAEFSLNGPKQPIHTYGQDTTTQQNDAPQPVLPEDIAVLNRYGIGQPYLCAAHATSLKIGVPALEILLQSGVISRENWLDAQNLLKDGQRSKSLTRETRQHLLVQAVHNLREQAPHYSAEQTFSLAQVLLVVTMMSVILAGGIILPHITVLALSTLLAVFYFSSILLRGVLLAAYEEEQPASSGVARTRDRDLPVYSVLVALYRESGQIGELTRHLQLLDWPQDKLDIKLICEEDDPDTVFAIKLANLPSCFELIVVPPALPRTKPKALNYALPLCRGDYLVLYDAEDRPSPGQLREAYETFGAAGPELACLQAPLHIHNGSQSWLSRMFAIEYLTLFNGILPVLAKWRVPIPLGGTSNHFRGLR